MTSFLPTEQSTLLTLVRDLSNAESREAAARLAAMPAETVAKVLRAMSPVTVDRVLAAAPDGGAALTALVPAHVTAQWAFDRTFLPGTVGRLMDPPVGVLSDRLSVAQAKLALRDVVRTEFVTYGYLVDEQQRLSGVLVMRDLLFAEDDTPVADIMVRAPFSLHPETPLMEAMNEVVVHHFPVYPVCDDAQRVVGLVRGYRLFESQAFEIISQAGRMVGVGRHEQSSTPLWQSFKLRHPWLQLNLLTALMAGSVVSFFRDAIDQIVVLAAFLPVLAGQAGNTGGQALAVTVRAMILDQLKRGSGARAVRKEALLGLANGAFVGLVAGLGMYLLAAHQGEGNALSLAFVVVGAMATSCALSGISGALVPLTLRRLGADPAMAASIFLTTATDIASIGLLLGLATWLVL
jgi:magnesium transporter